MATVVASGLAASCLKVSSSGFALVVHLHTRTTSTATSAGRSTERLASMLRPMVRSG